MDIIDFLARVCMVGVVAGVVYIIGRCLIVERGDWMSNDEANCWPTDDD